MKIQSVTSIVIAIAGIALLPSCASVNYAPNAINVPIVDTARQLAVQGSLGLVGSQLPVGQITVVATPAAGLLIGSQLQGFFAYNRSYREADILGGGRTTTDLYRYGSSAGLFFGAYSAQPTATVYIMTGANYESITRHAGEQTNYSFLGGSGNGYALNAKANCIAPFLQFCLRSNRHNLLTGESETQHQFGVRLSSQYVLNQSSVTADEYDYQQETPYYRIQDGSFYIGLMYGFDFAVGRSRLFYQVQVNDIPIQGTRGTLYARRLNYSGLVTHRFGLSFTLGRQRRQWFGMPKPVPPQGLPIH